MTWRSAEQIADALLYEGYLLYPYRASAVKNRYRWQFGIVAPRAYHAAGGSETWCMQTECLIERGAAPVLDLKVRFLQVEARRVEQRVGADEWQAVESLCVDGRELVCWDEAIPRELPLSGMALPALPTTALHEFETAGGLDTELVRDASGDVVARIVRERSPVSCTIRVDAEPAGAYGKARVRIENVTPWSDQDGTDRAAALRRSMIATHTLLAVHDGAFVSLLDPPAGAVDLAATCSNLHTWPVLVGDSPQRHLMLSSPIILYDYPAVAPESPGDLFDGTEIDELLTLRLRTLTEEERRQAVATDPRAGQLIDRALNLPVEQLERLHGAIRYLGTVTRPDPDRSTPAVPNQPALEEWLNPPGSDAEEAFDRSGRDIRRGTRVRLRPGRRADVMDMFLADQVATVSAVYRDLEDQAHVAVTIDAARAGDLHESVGRYFYFRPEEVEVIDDGAASAAPADGVSNARVLVAGIGNLFLGDDGFGSAVAQRLLSRALPPGVRVEDFGIRSVHLAYDLLEAAYDMTILIDAVSRGGPAGTLYVIEPELDEAPLAPHDPHTISVESVLGLLRGIGGEPGRVLIVGCEVETVDPGMGLSDAVARAVDEAADMVTQLMDGGA